MSNRILLLMLLWLQSFAAHAIGDLALTVDLPNGNVVPPETTARVVLTLTNHGPDTVPSVLAGTDFIATRGFRTFAVFPTSETPPCDMTFQDFIPPPPEPGFFNVRIDPLTDLAPGESAICIFGITTFPEAPPVVTANFSSSDMATDPNPDNNIVDLTIITQPGAQQIPTLSFGGLLILCSLLLGFSAWVLRTQPSMAR